MHSNGLRRSRSNPGLGILSSVGIGKEKFWGRHGTLVALESSLLLQFNAETFSIQDRWGN